MDALIPTGITANRREGKLIITWNDGEISELPFALLREACPCAECRGGHENMGTMPDLSDFVIPLYDSRAYQVKEIQQVGNYAINIVWADGHRHGIYHWSYLRALEDEKPD